MRPSSAASRPRSRRRVRSRQAPSPELGWRTGAWRRPAPFCGMTGRGVAALATVDPIGDRGGTCCITQPSNVATSGAMPGDSGNTVASSAGILVDHGQARLDGGAVLGVDRAVDGGREDDAPAFLQGDEGVAPGGIVGRAARAGDRDQTTAFGQARQRRRDMTERCIGHAAVDIGDGRERRVHQHDAGRRCRCRDDRRCARRRSGSPRCRERGVTRSPARVSANSLRTSEAPASSARMASSPVPADGSRTRSAGVIAAASARHKTERNRRAELLERLALFGAAGMGRKKAGDLGQHRQHGDRRCGACAHRRAELAQEQHRRRLTGVVGGLPVPGARSVGAAKSGVHRRRAGAAHRCDDHFRDEEGEVARPGRSRQIGLRYRKRPQSTRMRRQKRRCMSWK